MTTQTDSYIQFDPKTRQLTCQGDWNLAHLPAIEQELANLAWPNTGDITINGSAIQVMDSAGAWLLVNLPTQGQLNLKLDAFSEQAQKLLELVQKETKQNFSLPPIKLLNWVAKLGKSTLKHLDEFCEYLQFVGKLSFEARQLVFNPERMRWKSIALIIDQTGMKALPIIALLSFMIGVVIAYQMGLQLRNYGANIFIVDLLGLSILREFGPLITAIMVAGRTGSSFAAQLGTMKINEEIDALNTMGITSAEILIIPRIIGLVITLPLLTMWADIFGILGGMVMAKNLLDISWYNFMHTFQQRVHLSALIIGLGKTPIFALIISSIGCFEGMQVTGSADSVGKMTTRSVVLAIFFIIITDAMFSVIFSKLEL